MNCILVLVASDADKPLLESHLEKTEFIVGSQCTKSNWLAPAKAAELYFENKPTGKVRQELEKELAPDRIDALIVADDGLRKKKLLISDMDSTMVVGETLDDLAEVCGLKEEIARITERAMCGELDFQSALRTRVSMLKGLNATALQETCNGIQYMPGAKSLVKTMNNHGAKCVLVSGGFTNFTEPVAAELGFHVNHGNVVEIKNGVLTGQVLDPIVNHLSKRDYLHHYLSCFQLDTSQSLAVGDGANDLIMIADAGMGVGYHPKAFLKERAENSILYGDLTVLLYAQGYSGF